MADIPDRLPAPEKRKDKINKNDMRYLYRIQRSNQKATKRAVIEDEITNEKQKSEKRRRQTDGNAAVRDLRRDNQDMVDIMSDSILAPPVNVAFHVGGDEDMDEEDQVLWRQSMRVCWKKVHIPMFLCSPTVSDAEVQACSNPALLCPTVEEVEQRGDIPWKLDEYPHVIPHERLWLFCTACHRGMRSTHIRVNDTNAVHHHIPIERGGNVMTFKAFEAPPTIKWQVFHPECRNIL